MVKIFETITEIIGWLQIVACPLVIASAIGALVYFPNPSLIRLLIAISIVVAGLIFGIVWATGIWKRKGTVWFLSRVIASPDLDNKTDEQ